MTLVAEMIVMATKAKRNGPLSLVQEAEEKPYFLLRKGLQLALEGVNPQMVETTLQYYILAGKHLGKEFLQPCIIVQGVLSIQNVVNPTIIKELLHSLFGKNSYEIYKQEFGDAKIDRLKAFFKKIKKARPLHP